MLPSMQMSTGPQETAAVTKSVSELDTPPPGDGLTTVIGKVPAVVRSVARIAAVNCVELTKVVALSAPSKRTTDPDAPDTKPLPFTVSVNAPLFCGRLVGEMVLIVGGELTDHVTVLSVDVEALLV